MNSATKQGRIELLALLEEKHRRQAAASLVKYCSYIEIPGAPLNDNEECEEFYPDTVTPAAHHILLLSALDQMVGGDIRRMMIFMPPGSAKALALDTPIATPGGWTTMGELKIGDRVFGDDGRPCRVTWVSPIWRNRPVYKVTTDCGDQIIADRDHEWLVRLCGKREVYKIKETHELCRRRSKRPMILRADPLHLPLANLPLDPYVLGAWLGDGTSACGELPQVTVTQFGCALSSSD